MCDLVDMLSAARSALPWMWERGAAAGLRSSGEDGGIGRETGVDAGGASCLTRFGAGADGGGATAAKQPNMSSSMVQCDGCDQGRRDKETNGDGGLKK
jgi:hypothetical protein